jgi:hypothetical protein
MPILKICEKNRFSKFVREKESAEFLALQSWKRWFDARKIRCVIAYTKSGWALYRANLLEIPKEKEEEG